ncbi:peptidase inhibitor family I36 protein [Rothia sp. P7208]|uniref:peptidase inhibitor family I36 protein n=1 Tax=Rothia sp. P7208 TaxID=3402660 RepID=UPI003AC0022A
MSYSSLAKKTLAASGVAVALGTGSLVSLPAANASVYACPTSNVCVYEHEWFHGASQTISGYATYTDLVGGLHDRVTSWINANRYATEYLGDRSWWGQEETRYLPAGWYEHNLSNSGFNDRADYVRR